jgi:hypothetical protein
MKISDKKKKEILSSIRRAFTDKVSGYECFDSPPSTWLDFEVELWDNLDQVISDAIYNVEQVLNK